jgi:hypothetical protein
MKKIFIVSLILSAFMDISTAESPAAASLVSAVRADATNDRAAFVFTAASLTNDSYWFEFTYQIK